MAVSLGGAAFIIGSLALVVGIQWLNGMDDRERRRRSAARWEVERRRRRDQRIAYLERELGIGQDPDVPRLRQYPLPDRPHA